MRARTKLTRLCSILLTLVLLVGMLPTAALAAGTSAEAGTPDCYIEGSDGIYTGYNWMGGNPAVGDKDVYVHIVGTVPDGWTMVGGKWTGASYIDTDSNRLLNKADYEYQFTKSLTQTSKVSVGKNVRNQDVTIYRLTVDNGGTLEAGDYRIFLESADQYYVPSHDNLSIPDPASSEKYDNSIRDMELPLEISTGTTSVSFSCTVDLHGVNPDDATFELREGGVDGTAVGTVAGSALQQSARTGGYYEFRGTMPVSGLTGGTDLYLRFVHDKVKAPEWWSYPGPTTYVVPDGGAGQFILYGAEKDTTGAGQERYRSTYEKAVPGTTYYLTGSDDTTHTFVISGSSLSDVSMLSVTGGTLVADSLSVSSKNGVYTVTGGVTVSGSASALVFNYDGQEVHSVNLNRTELAGVTGPCVTSAEVGQAYENGDFTVKLSGFNLGRDAEEYTGANYAGETYTCESLTESNGIYTLLFKPVGAYPNATVNLLYKGKSLTTPYIRAFVDAVEVRMDPVSVQFFHPNLVDESTNFPEAANGYAQYVGVVRGSQILTIHGKGFDGSKSYTACFVPHTSAGFDTVITADCTYVSDKKLTANAASVGTGWYTMYITEGNTVIPQFLDVALYEDVSAPQLPVITVNGGKTVTTSQKIALSIDGGDYTEVRIAESTAELESALWQAVDSLTSYTLSEGYGVKTLYFEFRTAENEIYSETARVTYSDTALSGAEYGISGAGTGNIVYAGSKYTLYIQYTGTGYVKGQAEICDENGTVRETVELRRVSTVGTTSTYTGKTDFALTDAQIVFSLIDESGNAASADPMAVTVAEDLVITAANAPQFPRDYSDSGNKKISCSDNYTLEFNGTPGKQATAVFAFDPGDSVTVNLSETEGKPGHYLFDGSVIFPDTATTLNSITYRLTGETQNAAETAFAADEFGNPYSTFALSPALKITNIPEFYKSEYSYLEITSNAPGNFIESKVIYDTSATFKYLDKGTYDCKIVMSGIVMHRWTVKVNSDTTYDYTTGSPVDTVKITMDITPPGSAETWDYRYVNCVYTAADNTEYQFSLPCDGSITLPKQGTLRYKLNLSTEEKLMYRPITGTVELAAGSQTITASPKERSFRTVTGTVKSILGTGDSSDTPIPLNGVSVLVVQSLDDDLPFCIVNRATTDINGNYTISVCEGSDVTITFSRSDHETITKTVAKGTAADADNWDATMPYAIRNLIMPKLFVNPIVDPDIAKDEALQPLQPLEITTDQLRFSKITDQNGDSVDYKNTVLEHNGIFKNVAALQPGYTDKTLKLQFELSDPKLVLLNDGEITVTTDDRATAVAELTATYKGYLRINALEEANTVYMLVFDKAKYDAGSGDAYVGMAYGNGLVTTEELHLDAGTYKVFVFKGNSIATSISTLRSVELLQQYLEDGILNDNNCKRIEEVTVENGKITQLADAVPDVALTGEELCNMRFVTDQTESGDLRVKFYMDKAPKGKKVLSMDLVQDNRPENDLTEIYYNTDLDKLDQDEFPSGEFYLGRNPNINKAEGTLSVTYVDNDGDTPGAIPYTITFKISETLSPLNISLEMSPIFSTAEGRIDISGQTKPNANVTLQIGGLEAGSVAADARGHYAATLRVTGAENGSIYPITASVDVDGKTYTAQGRTTASTNKIEVLNIKTRHYNAAQKTVIHIDNLYAQNQAQSQVLPYSPYESTTVSFQLTGCKREALDSVYLITYDQYGNEDKTFKAVCTEFDDAKYTSNWEVTENLEYFSSMGVRYFLTAEENAGDNYELITGNELADISGLLNVAGNLDDINDLKSIEINLAEAPNVIRQHAEEASLTPSAPAAGRSSFARTAAATEGESLTLEQNLGGTDEATAGKLEAEISMAAPMTEKQLEEQGYLKMDTQQGAVWIKQEVVKDEETGEITYARRMYVSPEIAEAAGLQEAEASPATTFAARSITDTALQGIDFIGNLQGGAEFFHSLNGEMAAQFKNTALGSTAVGNTVTILGAAGTVIKIASGPSSQSPEKLLQMVKLIKNSSKRKALMREIQDYIELSNDLYYTDCIGSSLLSGVGFVSNVTPLTKGVTLFGGIAFGVVNTWTGDELASMYASIENSILAVLQSESNKIGKDVKIPDFNLLIDPSGYVFEAVEDNRVEGVTATVFEVDVSGNATAWTDSWTGQENPQTTGNDGRYGWDVPTGNWKVSFDKEGYQHAESKTMTVYPAHTEVNIGLLSTAVPTVTAAAIVDNKLEVQFSMYMQADTSSCAITVYDEDMQIVPGTVSFPKAVDNTGYKDGTYQRDAIAAEEFTRWATFTPSDDYVGGFHDGETYTVKVSKNALSYAGVPMAADYINTISKPETVSTLATPTASVDSGVFKTIQTVGLTAGDGASIFYTTDGTAPNENSALYTGPITLSSNTTLKFIAIKTGYNSSPVGEETYVIELSGKASKPTANVTSGTYSGTLSVKLSSQTPGAKIYYTLNGSEPTTSSAEYVRPVSISATTTLKAIAVIGGLDNSDVSTFEYRISSSGTPVDPGIPENPGGGNSGGGSSTGGGSSSTPTYKVEVEVSKDADGSVSFSKNSAKKGDTVTITVTPDRYYKVAGVSVKDKNGKEIAVTDNGDGTFTFQMPDSKVTVEPVFSWDNPFGDVAEDTYYAPAVEWALKNDVTNGTSATTFSPNAGCTRGQIVTFLWKAAGCPEPAGMSSFTDVSADAYYAKAVAWAVEQGITDGTGDGKFSPDAVCTRSQSMTFIYRSEQAKGGGMQGEWMFQNPFDDVNQEDYYGEAVMWAVANGVTSGTSDTTFSPNATCTRGQIVTFLYRYFVK